MSVEMVITQFAHLVVSHFCQAFGGETQAGTPQARCCINILTTVVVINANAVPTLGHFWPRCLMMLQVRLRMNDARNVAGGDRVGSVSHWMDPFSAIISGIDYLSPPIVGG